MDKPLSDILHYYKIRVSLDSLFSCLSPYTIYSKPYSPILLAFKDKFTSLRFLSIEKALPMYLAPTDVHFVSSKLNFKFVNP